MNVCERYEIMISAMLDGELDERERAELSAHIAGCERCAALAAAFAASSGALAEEELEEPPAGLHDAVMEKVGAAAKVRRSQARFMRLRPVIAAAACAAVVAVTLLAANSGLRNAMNTAAGGAESYDAAPEAPAYAEGGGNAALNGAFTGTGDAGEEGEAFPMEAPAPNAAPAGAAMDNAAPSEVRGVNDASVSKETVAENGDEAEEPESDADAPAALPELEAEIVAAGEDGAFTANVIADPSGRFAPGTTVTILTDETVSPGMRVTVRYSTADAESVTAEEIEINE